MLVYVWAYEQEHKKFATQDVFVPWHLHDTYEEQKKQNQKDANPENSKFIDTAIKDDNKQATVYHRYYHVFKEGEMVGADLWRAPPIAPSTDATPSR